MGVKKKKCSLKTKRLVPKTGCVNKNTPYPPTTTKTCKITYTCLKNGWYKKWKSPKLLTLQFFAFWTSCAWPHHFP